MNTLFLAKNIDKPLLWLLMQSEVCHWKQDMDVGDSIDLDEYNTNENTMNHWKIGIPFPRRNKFHNKMRISENFFLSITRWDQYKKLGNLQWNEPQTTSTALKPPKIQYQFIDLLSYLSFILHISSSPSLKYIPDYTTAQPKSLWANPGD